MADASSKWPSQPPGTIRRSTMRPATSYEEREGGSGANIYFRSQRFPAKELLERVPAVLFVDDEPHDIFDLSMNGVSFFAADRTREAKVGATLPVRIRVGDESVYEGKGEVARIDQHRLGLLVALRLTVGFLDIPRLVSTHDQVVLSADLERGALSELEQIAPQYRQLGSDMVACLRHYRSVSRRYEEQISLMNRDRRGRYEDMLNELFEHMHREWETLRVRANELTRDAASDPERLARMKRFTERMVTPELVAGPAWERAYSKPLGYPGDYVVMDYFYAQAWEGATAYEKITHRLLTSHPLASCVIPRMEMLRDAIAETVEARSGRDEPVRIASLGSGPAREVEEYLGQIRPRQPIEFLLIDQDEGALSHAHSKVYPLTTRSTSPVKVECLYVSFSQLLKNPDLLESLALQDLIYAAGLVDYLKEGTAKTIMKMLWGRLAPQGSVVVGNMRERADVGWTNELALDWRLIFRSESDMRELVADLSAASVDVRLDRTGYTYLLYARSR